jgi:hypothetical protein
MWTLREGLHVFLNTKMIEWGISSQPLNRREFCVMASSPCQCKGHSFQRTVTSSTPLKNVEFWQMCLNCYSVYTVLILFCFINSTNIYFLYHAYSVLMFRFSCIPCPYVFPAELYGYGYTALIVEGFLYKGFLTPPHPST